MATKGSVFTVVLFGLVTCLPLFLALRLFVRLFNRARRRSLPTGRFVAAIAITFVAFLFNLGVLLGTGRAIANGGMPFGVLQGLAAGFAWVGFWVWLFLALTLGRKRNLH